MSAASSSASRPEDATHKDPRGYYWKNTTNGSGGAGTWYVYNSRDNVWDQAQKPGDITSIQAAPAAEEDDDEEDDGEPSNAAAAPAGAAQYRGDDEEERNQQEEYDEDEDAPVEGEDTFEDGPDWEYGQPRHAYTDSLGLSDKDGAALYAAIGDGDFSEAFADALAHIGVENPDDEDAAVDAAVEGGEINDYGKIVARAFGAGVESVVSSPGSRPGLPTSAPRSASAPAAAAEPYPDTLAGFSSMAAPNGTQMVDEVGDAPEAPPSPSAAASSSSSSSSAVAAATPRGTRARRPPVVFSPVAVRARREGRVAEPSAAGAGASASPPGLVKAPSLAASSAVRTLGSEVSAATKRTVLHRSQVEQTRLDTTNPDRWGSKSTSVDEFNRKTRLDELCILCSCKFRERLSGNKVSGKKNLAGLKPGVKPSDVVLESFKGISLDHHLPVNFLCALVGGITAKGFYTARQYEIFALTGDLVCWNCNYVKNDALFATLRRSLDGTFAGLKVSKPGIKGFCEKLWANENKEGLPFLPADVTDAKRLGAKNTLQLAVLRKMKNGTTLAQAKAAWMTHQIPILEDRTQLLLNKIREYAWPRRAINRLKALGIAKRAQDKITETLPAYKAAKAEFDRLTAEINRLKGGADKDALKTARDAASASRTTMNKLKISNGTQRVLTVLAKLDEVKPVWLPGTPPTQGEKTQAGGATFVPGVEFQRGPAAPARPRVPEAVPATVAVITAAKAASRPPAPAAAAAASALQTVQEDEDEDDGVVREGSLEPVDQGAAADSALDTSLSNIAPSARRRRGGGGGFNAHLWNQLQQEQHQAGSARKTRRRRGHRGTRRIRRYAEARS